MSTDDLARTADHGREAVYAAEEAAFGGTDIDRTVSFRDVEALASGVVASEWWSSCGAPAVTVVGARADASSSSARPIGATEVLIRLAPSQWTAGTVAHELAHALAGIDHGHDACFRAAHVDVVAVLGGSVLSRLLAQSFHDHGVPPGDRTWPPPERGRGQDFVIVP